MQIEIKKIHLENRIKEIEDLFKITQKIFINKFLDKYKTIDELKNCEETPGKVQHDIYEFLLMMRDWDEIDYKILSKIITQNGVDAKTDDKYNLFKKVFSKWIAHEKTYHKDYEDLNYYIEKFIDKDTEISYNTEYILDRFYEYTQSNENEYEDEECEIGYDYYDYGEDEDFIEECSNFECDNPSLCPDCKIYKKYHKPLKNRYYDNTEGYIYPIRMDRASVEVSIMQSDKIDKLVAAIKDKEELNKYMYIYIHAYVSLYYFAYPEYSRISYKDEYIKGVGKNNKYNSAIYSIVVDRMGDIFYPWEKGLVRRLSHAIVNSVYLEIIDMIVDDAESKII